MKIFCRLNVVSSILLLMFSVLTVYGNTFQCQKTYPQHLQGFDCDANFIYWSFSDMLVKTDWQGKEIKAVKVPYHHGDMCLKDNRIYVAVNFGRFNDPAGNAKNFIYVYDANDLKKVAEYKVDEVKYGAGAITPTENGFMVAGGLPPDPANYPANLLYEYDKDFKFIGCIKVAPWTLSGVQVIYKAPGGWLLAGHRNRVIVCDNNFKFLSDEGYNATHGIMRHPVTGKFYRAVSVLAKDKGWQATVYPLPVPNNIAVEDHSKRPIKINRRRPIPKPSAKNRERDSSGYGLLVATQIKRMWVTPDRQRLQGREPEVTFKVTIAPNGRVISKSIVRSSGVLAMDQSVQELLDTLQFVKAPPDGKTTTLTFNLTAKDE